MTAATTLMTAEELFASPHQKHCELVNGELITMAPTGGEHGTLTINITLLLGAFVQKHQLGTCVAAETGFLLSRNPDTVRGPDFAFIPKDRVPPEGISEKFLTLVPALVVEVLSPRDRAMAVSEKIEDWLRFGVDQVWIINPKLKTLTIHTSGHDPHVLHQKDAINTIAGMPGFSLAVADIF